MADCIRLHDKDNVATVLRRVRPGDRLQLADAGMQVIGEITAVDEIPFAHKISLADLEKDAAIIKYGERIGLSTAPIPMGGYVHVHNVVSIEGSKRFTENPKRD